MGEDVGWHCYRIGGVSGGGWCEWCEREGRGVLLREEERERGGKDMGGRLRIFIAMEASYDHTILFFTWIQGTQVRIYIAAKEKYSIGEGEVLLEYKSRLHIHRQSHSPQQKNIHHKTEAAKTNKQANKERN